MTCYKDMTFCPFWVDCKDACHWGRALTDEVIKGANEWWGDNEGDAPIAMFREPPECYRSTKDE